MSDETSYDPAAPCTVEVGFDVPSDDLMQQTLDFYINGLGFQDFGLIDIEVPHLKVGPVKVRALRLGNSTLKFKHDLSSDRPDAPRAMAPNSTHYATIRVRSIEKTVARLQALDPKPPMFVEPTKATMQQGGHGLFAFTMDPIGNQIEVVEGRPWSGTKNDDVV